MEKLDQAKLIDDVNKTGRNVNTIDDLIKMGPNDKDLIPIYQAGSEKRVKEIGEGKIKRITYPLFRKESTKYTRNVSAVATLTPRQVERYRLRPCGRRKIDAMPSFIENLMLIIEERELPEIQSALLEEATEVSTTRMIITKLYSK